MKKVMITLAVIALTFASCKKENVAPGESNSIENTEDCNCGVIVQETESTVLSGGSNGSPGLITMYDNYKVRNDCSGNVKWFNKARQFNNKNDVGDTFCTTYKW